MTRLRANEKVVGRGSSQARAVGDDSRRSSALAAVVKVFVMATLEVCSDPDGREFFELTADETIVGRIQFCDIVLRNHTVSRRHARIVRTDDGFFIEDLSSLNGTYLNGRRWKAARRSRTRTEIHIYEVVTVFHAGLRPTKHREATHDDRRRRSRRPLPEETAELPAVAAEWSPRVAAERRSRPRQRRRPAFARRSRSRSIWKASSTSIRSCPRFSTACSRSFRRPCADTFCWPKGPTGTWCRGPSSTAKARAGHSMTFGPISRKTALHVMSTGEAIIMDDGADRPAECNQSVFEPHACR